MTTTTGTPLSWVHDGQLVLDNGQHAATLDPDIAALLWNEANSSELATAAWPCDCHAARQRWGRDHLAGAIDLATHHGLLATCTEHDAVRVCERPITDTHPNRCTSHRKW